MTIDLPKPGDRIQRDDRIFIVAFVEDGDVYGQLHDATFIDWSKIDGTGKPVSGIRLIRIPLAVYWDAKGETK